MIKRIVKCKSQTLFELKNRESLEKLKSKSKKEAIVCPLLLPIPHKDKLQLKKDQRNQSEAAKFKQRIKTQMNSSMRKDHISLSRSRIASPHRSNKQLEKQANSEKEVKQIKKPIKQKLTISRKPQIKKTLKIQSAQQFKSIIPKQGFIEGEDLIVINNMHQHLTISANGVLVQHRSEWKFQHLDEYEVELRRIQKLVRLDFFKYFSRFKAFYCWKRYIRELNHKSIIRHLSNALIFNPNSIRMALKHQQILVRVTNNNFLKNFGQLEGEVQLDKFNEYLFQDMSGRLSDIKFNLFEESCMDLITNLRSIIKEHQIFDNEGNSFKLSDHTFEDYFIRQNIENHKLLFKRLLWQYEQIKIQAIFSILDEIQMKARFNIDKWKINFKGELTLMQAVSRQFSQQDFAQFDSTCFYHERIIKQIIIRIQPTGKIDCAELQKTYKKSFSQCLQRIHQFFSQKYDNKNRSNMLTFITKLLARQDISRREYSIIQQCLSKIDTYNFTEHYKSAQQEIHSQVQRIWELYQSNLEAIQNVILLIEDNFLYTINELLNSTVSFEFQYCSFIEKLSHKIKKVPTKMNMGMFVIDLQHAISFYDKTISDNYSIILNRCLDVYEGKVAQIEKVIGRFDGEINISSWNILLFIKSYQCSNQYNTYFEQNLKVKFRELDSIILTIHRTQPRFYQQSYLELFRAKEKSESTRSKSMCFMRQVPHKLAYLRNQKDKKVSMILKQIDNVQQSIGRFTNLQGVSIQSMYSMLNQINNELKKNSQDIEEIEALIFIEKIYSDKETKPIQFLTFQKLNNQVSFLQKILNSYKQFQELMNSELDKEYLSFRLQLIVDSIHNEVTKIKQSLRFLHHYEAFLLKMNGLYQDESQKIRYLRLVMKLEIKDLVKLDPKRFKIYQKYSARIILEYIIENEDLIKRFLQEKEYALKLKQKIQDIETKISEFVLLGQLDNNEFSVSSELHPFLQTLFGYQIELEGYFKCEHLKQMKSQIQDTLQIMKKSSKFLTQYNKIYEQFTTYYSYLKERYSEKVINKFTNIFKEQKEGLNQIRSKWKEINQQITEKNIRTIVSYNYQQEISKLYSLQSLIKAQVSKININLHKRIEEFPLFNLLSRQFLINVINKPLLFLQYIHSTVRNVKLQYCQNEPTKKKGIVIETIYHEHIVIPFEQSEDEENQQSEFKIQLQNTMNQLNCQIKNNIVNLINNSFQLFIELIFNQKLPMQVIFVSDQINNLNTLKKYNNIPETSCSIDRNIEFLVNYYKNKQAFSKYQIFLIDILLISKLEFKNKLNYYNESVWQQINYQKKDDDITLEFFNDSIKLDYQLVDPSELTIIEPFNYRILIKLYQSVIQIKNSLLFESSGLQNLSFRLMRHLFIVNQHEIPIEKALNVTIKSAALFYIKSDTNESQQQFYNRIKIAFDLVNNAIIQKQKRNRVRSGSLAYIQRLTPLIFIEIPRSIYKKSNGYLNNFKAFHKQMPVEIKICFRVIQFFEPSLCLIFKVCLLRQCLQLQQKIQAQIIKEIVKYKNHQQNESQIIMNHKDVILIIEAIFKNINFIDKLEIEHVKVAFASLYDDMAGAEIMPKNKNKKKVCIYKNRLNKEKEIRYPSRPVLKWEETKIHLQFIRFSKELDEIFQMEEIIIILGKSCYGKSYMIKLYSQLVNAQIASQKQKGKIGGCKSIKLQGIDLSLIKFDNKYIENQIKHFNSRQKQFQNDFICLIWLDGLEYLQIDQIESILHKNWLISLENIQHKLIIELRNIKDLNPRLALTYKYVLVKERSFAAVEIIHSNNQQIHHLLSDNILLKPIDPFSIFVKIFKDFFSQIKASFPKIFIIDYEQEMIILHTFQLLTGIIKFKTPSIINQLKFLSDYQKIQILRKLFAFCFLWLTSALIQQTVAKKFEQQFLELCKLNAIDTQGIGSNYVINHKSDSIEYLPINTAKNSILKGEEYCSDQKVIFIETYQTVILKNLLSFISCNSHSQIMMFGQRESGKTSLLRYFAVKSNTRNCFYYLCSIYSHNSIKKISKSIKQVNIFYERDNVEKILKQGQNKDEKWYTKLTKIQCVFVENVSLELWEPLLRYFKYINSHQRAYIDGQLCDFKNLHLLVQRKSHHQKINEEAHFIPVRVHYDDGYYNQVFHGVYEVACKNSILSLDIQFQALKIKSIVVKHLLFLIKIAAKKIKHSLEHWNYFYPISTLKNVLVQLKSRTMNSRNQFLQNMFQILYYQLFQRLDDEVSKVTMCKIYENFRKLIKQDLREDLPNSEVKNSINKEEIITKLTNYLQFRNQFKNLKTSDTLISNLTNFYLSMGCRHLIVTNYCLIPGVGEFLPIAAQILGLQLIEITSIEQFNLTIAQKTSSSSINRFQEIVLYYFPSGILKNNELMSYLANKIRDLQCKVDKKSHFRPDLFNSQKNTFYFIIQYSENVQKKELNLLKYSEIMKSGVFLHILHPLRDEQLIELNQYLGRERLEINHKQNQIIINKIKQIYQILQREQNLKKMDSKLYRYLFSIENYSRFIKTFINTYFEKKSELKSILDNLELAIIKLEQFIEEHRIAKSKNFVLKNSLNESKKKIVAFQQSLSQIKQMINQLQNAAIFNKFKKSKVKLKEYTHQKKKMLGKQKLLVQSIESFKNIPRMEIANLKSLANNNQALFKFIFEIISLLINDSDDQASIKKTILDINLNMRIKELNFLQKDEEIIKKIREKINNNIFDEQQFKVCYNLVHWISCSTEYYFFKQQIANISKIISQYRQQTFNTDVLEIEDKIQKLNLQFEENQEKLEKEKEISQELQSKLKRQQNLLKTLSNFKFVDNFQSQCIKEKAYLDQQLKLCLQSSIYFSIQLNFIFPCEVNAGVSLELSKGKQRFGSFRALIEQIFIKWCYPADNTVDLQFFQKQIFKIFENKEKFEFIDEQIQSKEDKSCIIAKGKHLGKLGKARSIVDRHSEQHNEIGMYVPKIIYNKLTFLKYILNIRENSNKVMFYDPSFNLYKYLGISITNRLIIKRSIKKHEYKTFNQIAQLIGYRLKASQSPLLSTNFNILFIEVPANVRQLSILQINKQSNASGLILKVNSNEFLIPSEQILKVIFICTELIQNFEIMHQFYFINFQQNSIDASEMINNEILKQHLGSMSERFSLINCLRQSTTDFLYDIQIKQLVNSNQKERIIELLQNSEKELKFDIINNFINECTGGRMISLDSFFQKYLSMTEDWKRINEDWVYNTKANSILNIYQQKYINSFTANYLQIYKQICSVNKSLNRNKVQLEKDDKIHSQFLYFMKIASYGIGSLISNQGICLETLLLELEKYILNYYCNLTPMKNSYTFMLFIKIYSLRHDMATKYELLDLFFKIDDQLFLELLIQKKADNYSHATSLEMPVFKLQIQQFYKSHRKLKKKIDPLQKDKNFIINHWETSRQIESFQFSTSKEKGQSIEQIDLEFQDNLQLFHQPTLFTKFILRKLLLPEIFPDLCWPEVSEWKNRFIPDKYISCFLEDICIYPCNLQFWDIWLSNNTGLKNIEIIKITDLQVKLEDKLNGKDQNKEGLRIIIDQRQFIQVQMKQRIKEYFTIPKSNTIILIKQKNHHKLHQLTKFNEKSAKYHCLNITHFYEIIKFVQYRSNTRKTISTVKVINEKPKQDPNQIKMNQCIKYWQKMKIYQLTNCKNEVQRFLLEPILQLLQNDLQNISKYQLKCILKIIASKYLIWESYGRQYIENYQLILQDISSRSTSDESDIPVSLIDHEQTETDIQNRAQNLVKSLTKNKSAIISYFKYKFNTKFKEGVKPEFVRGDIRTRSKQLANESEDPESRFAVHSFESKRQLFVNEQINQNFRRNLSRVKPVAPLKKDQQFNIQYFLELRAKEKMFNVQKIINKILDLWKIYEGQSPIYQNYHLLEKNHMLSSNNFQKFILRNFEEVVRQVNQFEELVEIKESKKMQILYNEQNMNVMINSIRQCGIFHLNYHYCNSKKYELILKCYDSEKCQDCLYFAKKKNNEKICICLSNNIYQLCVNNNIFIKSHEIPIINIRSRYSQIQAKIYCKKIQTQLL